MKATRRAVIGGLALCGAGGGSAFAQAFDEKALRDALKAATGIGTTAFSAAEGDKGLREALAIGAKAAVSQVGRRDGYWLDGLVQIPLPDTLASLQRSLKPLRLSGPLDDLQLRMNRAAETAAPKALSLFTGAIRAMTVEDAIGIVRGGDTSATDYLRARTGDRLTAEFRPPVERALASSGALTSLDRVSARYGAQAIIGDSPRTSLTNFALGKALDGLFYYVAKEERAIRSDPAKRTTAILRKVFG